MLKLTTLVLVAGLLLTGNHPVVAQQTGRSSFPIARPPATAALFEPGIISIGAATTYRPAFTPDQRTVYYTMEVGNDYVILVAHFRNHRWSTPEIASFSGKYSDAEPYLSPDGLRLFFASKRPAAGDQPKKDYDLWMVQRSRGGPLGSPQRLPDSINTDVHELYPAVTSDGTLYFSRFGPGGIWRARQTNGQYVAAEKLGTPINADMKEAGAYVAPSGRYLIFEAKNPKGLGGTDFYISYQRDGAWTEPRNLGPVVNSSAEETCAMVSPDGRYLFFTSSRKLPDRDVAIGKGLNYTEMMARPNSPGRGRWHLYYVATAAVGID